ncbi:type I secretion system permease/ATPase [Paenibacillus tengchongensis]|uniref:type I secretion system permease/ATPase n=1 Tax=Paenibacillus tengchongensis TaxID=2608684 RepID=UPI00124DBBBB|nr:type I secretion system permease/ATPase [Paenibacillus tengchongensis]
MTTAVAQEELPQRHNEGPRIDTGLQCLMLVANYHNISADYEQIKHSFAIDDSGMDTLQMIKAARELGLKCKQAKVAIARVAKLPLPAVIRDKDGLYFVLAKIQEGQYLIFDPRRGKPSSVPGDEFTDLWNGEIILFSPKVKSETSDEFGIKWFLPALWRHKKILAEVLIASLFLQLFGLVSPLITQVIIDKVLVHHGLTTLNVLATALFIIILFELVLGICRTYVFTHTTSRVDITLSTKLFSHLFRLPLSYFENRRTGSTIARVRELENIRQFLTGSPFTAVLDVLFIVVYIAVMFAYSTQLTFIVLGTLPVFALLSVIFTPLLRNGLEERFRRGAESQSYLVEAVSGIQTIKSFALEPISQKKWEGLLSNYTRSSFKVLLTSGVAGALAQFIQKASNLVVLFYGTHLVLKGTISVGQLIAFQMLAGRVSDPVLRMVQMWQDFQQTGISIDKLKDIFEVKPEPAVSASKTRMPRIRGQIQFEGVTFRYRVDGPEIVRNLTFAIAPGTIVGMVGRSGSGKSTVSKLVQRLYVPESGKILVDGVDISLADPSWLRRQIGVVLQENFLFSGTIRENIALNQPTASIQDIVKVATLAGAHEFIIELTEGYDTVIGERGEGLSGGQRQRIAIARALLSNPRILIFDEATSALDYESERIIQKNLQQICQGRTVIIIAHRLSTLRTANRIMVLDKGQLVESGTHQALMDHKGLYHYLYNQQERD